MPSITRSMSAISKIQSLDDLTEVLEVFTGEIGEPTFSHTSLTFIDSDSNVYAGRFLGRKHDLTLKDAKNLLKRIPDEEIYPEPPPQFTMAPASTDGYHVKLAQIVSLETLKGSCPFPSIVLAEVTALEMLSADPHPNIVKYHGCIVKRGRIVGIVLDKYASTLEDRLLKDPRPFNKKLFLEQLKSAINHVHKLGLAHNDINPNNIMLDENDVTFLIDFGSSKPFDEELISGGTPGWMAEGSRYDMSKQSHDTFAFSKLQEWIKKPTKNSFCLNHPEIIPVSRRQALMDGQSQI